MRDVEEDHRLQVGHGGCRPVEHRQRIVDADGVEAVFAKGFEDPRPQRWREFRGIIQIGHAEALLPRFAIVGLPKKIGLDVVDAETEEGIPLRRDKPPALVLLHTKEACRLEPLALPATEAVAFRARSRCAIGPGQSSPDKRC